MEWQPIETAPKDGTEILTLVCGGPVVVSWRRLDAIGYPREAWRLTHGFYVYDDGTWDFNNEVEDQPTHWLPLPPLPDNAISGA